MKCNVEPASVAVADRALLLLLLGGGEFAFLVVLEGPAANWRRPLGPEVSVLQLERAHQVTDVSEQILHSALVSHHLLQLRLLLLLQRCIPALTLPLVLQGDWRVACRRRLLLWALLAVSAGELAAAARLALPLRVEIGSEARDDGVSRNFGLSQLRSVFLVLPEAILDGLNRRLPLPSLASLSLCLCEVAREVAFQLALRLEQLAWTP